MRAVNPHSLLKQAPQNIDVCEEISDLYFVWKELISKTGSENEFNSFVAGFFLGTNSTLRKKYKELKTKDEFDSRYN